MKQQYEIIGEEFVIEDEELAVHIRSTLDALDRDQYPNGDIRHEVYRKDGRLHGPSTYYGQDGEVLSLSWFYEGERVGRAMRYYPNGALYCIERYVEGKPHGLQEYFYLDGSVKSLINFAHGIYDGETKLYWPDGTLKRECVFSSGEKVKDQLYDENGKLAKALS